MRSIPLVVFAALVAAQAAGADSFFEGVDDLPLMPGLVEREGERSTFQTATGRIVARGASGTVSREAVTRFYDEALPQLGWTREAAGIFLRNGEKLMIEFARPRAGFARPRAGTRTLEMRILITPG